MRVSQFACLVRHEHGRREIHTLVKVTMSGMYPGAGDSCAGAIPTHPHAYEACDRLFRTKYRHERMETYSHHVCETCLHMTGRNLSKVW